MPDAAPTRFIPPAPAATNTALICVGTHGLMDNPWCPDAMQTGYPQITGAELLRRRQALLSTIGACPKQHQAQKTNSAAAAAGDEKSDARISLLVKRSLCLATLSAMAEPGKRTGIFYTLLSNAKDLIRYYAENGVKVVTAETTSVFTGWVVVIGFKTHIRVQQITQLVAFRSKTLIADGSNAIMSKNIMTYHKTTQKRVAKTNTEAHYHDEPGVYDPTQSMSAKPTRNWNGLSCLHYNVLYEPLALDPAVHTTLIGNLSTMLAMSFDRFPPIHQLPEPSDASASASASASESAPLPVYTAYLYFHPTAGKSQPRFQAAPPPEALAGVTALHPVEITRMRTGCKLPSLCSAIVDKMGKAGTLPELYVVAMRFLANGVSAAEATVIFKKPRAALESAKKMHKCSVEGTHVVAKTGTPFYVV